MNPDTPQVPPSPNPVDFPPVAAVPQSADPSGGKTTIAQQAEALVNQYGQDPYRLQGALQQLKTQYLAEQFHVNVNAAEE